jgi:putative component of toxin-antitoxin plasmid stabilization module
LAGRHAKVLRGGYERRPVGRAEGLVPQKAEASKWTPVTGATVGRAFGPLRKTPPRSGRSRIEPQIVVTASVAYTRGWSEVDQVTPEWSVEMYTDVRGRCPIQDWFDTLSTAKFAAMDAAIRHRLQKQGIGLAGTAWLKPLKDGLYEFRVRSTAAEIVRMYAEAGHVPPEDTETILLRVFVSFHGNRVVLLLDGYDKAADPSPKRQQREIAAARKLLVAWKSEIARERKAERRGR